MDCGALWSFQIYIGLLFRTKLYLLCIVSYSVDFKAHWELWNSLSKAILSKCDGSDGHSKGNSLQDWANFHRSRAWSIVLFFSQCRTVTNTTRRPFPQYEEQQSFKPVTDSNKCNIWYKIRYFVSLQNQNNNMQLFTWYHMMTLTAGSVAASPWQDIKKPACIYRDR